MILLNHPELLLLGFCASCFAVFWIIAGPKIVSHLMLKYLRRRLIAWWALLAVALCTTMVLVVISVMGGWLDMFEHSFQGLTGDIVIESRDDFSSAPRRYVVLKDQAILRINSDRKGTYFEQDRWEPELFVKVDG